MNKRKFILPIAAFFMAFALGLGACSGNPSGPGESGQQQQEKITISAADNKTTITKGQTLQLTASVGGVAWESGNAEVATVNGEGLVTAVNQGSVTITAKKNGYQDGTIKLKVELVKINVTAAGNKTTLELDETVQLSADQQDVTWESSDAAVASVTGGLVTALKAGSATITAKKDGFTSGTIKITVNRAAKIGELHFEDAQHDSADGWWGTAAEGATPIYARTEGNASDQQCIAHFGAGDKETLKFKSSAAIKTELVITMACSNTISDLSTVMTAKINGQDISLANVAVNSSSTNDFVEVSFGDVTLAADNTLVLEFIETESSVPYLDDVRFHSKQAATITLTPAPEKKTIVPALATIAAYIDTENQIQLTDPVSLDGVSFSSDKEDIVSVDENGKLTGHKLGTATITIKKDGWYSARIEAVADKAGVDGEIRVQAEDQPEDFDWGALGFHRYTDKTSGIQNGHYGSAYVTGYDVNSECSLTYTFESPKDQMMTLIIAGASHYQMAEDFVFGVDAKLKLNDVEIRVNEDAKIESNQVMGAPTVEVTIGLVQVKQGTNTFVIEFPQRAPALDAFRFIPANVA